ncbi:porin [Paraburkholderia sp. NPDC080076]|jgi:predicted porin|uniref:porin n=1 Tax=unclassified Paraburkholderia TaxID=2615204 RepID=UPI0038BC996A
MTNKKICVALAFGAVSGIASAQSSVTLYGLLDVGIEYKNQVPTTTGNKTNSSQVQMQAGNLLGDRWGLKGVEDLGGGLKAIFTLESGFLINTGQSSQGGREFGRTSVVGLDSKTWGTVTVGRQKNLAYEYLWTYDPLQFAFYSAYPMDSFLASRMDNSVRYTINRAGFTLGGMYSTGFDSTIVNGAQVPGASKVGREWELMAMYQGSLPISAGVVFDQQQGTSIATQSNALQRVVAGASYTYGSLTGYLGYRWLNGQNGASAQSSNLYWSGLFYRFTPAFSLSAGGYHMQIRNLHNGPTSGVILADYFVSKTTDFYAQVSKIWNTKGSNVGIDGAGFNTSFGASQTGGMVGIRHTF